jgi:hypothetical protein
MYLVFHLFTYMYIYVLVNGFFTDLCIYLFMKIFIYSFMHLLIQSFFHSFIYAFM